MAFNENLPSKSYKNVLTNSEYTETLSRKNDNIEKTYTSLPYHHQFMDNYLQYSCEKNDALKKKEFQAVMEVCDNVIDFVLTSISDDLRKVVGFECLMDKMISGSVCDRTKVGLADEFDYIILIIPKHQRTIHLIPSKYKSTNIEYKPKSFCEIHVQKAANIEDTDFVGSKELVSNTLQAGHVFREFFRLVRSCFKENVQISQRGTAVSLYIKHHRCKDPIKLDISLGIEIDELNMTKCLEQSDSGLFGIPSFAYTDSYHVMCSGEYWKLSVCQLENYIVRSMPESYRYVYKSLKILKEEQAVTHKFETSTMSSYPLKAATIHKMISDVGDKGGIFLDAIRVLSLVDKVNVDGMTPTLESPFMKGDPIFKESDKGYYEARRIATFAMSIQAKIQTIGIFHTAILFLILCLGIIHILLLESLFHGTMAATSVIGLYHIIPVVANLLLSVAGLISLVKPYFNQKDIKEVGIIDIYDFTCLIQGYYMVLFLASFIDSVFTLIYVTGIGTYNKRDSFANATETVIYAMAYLGPLLITGHILLVVIITRGQLIKHRWEWIFTKFLFKRKTLS